MGDISIEPGGQAAPHVCPHCGNESHTVSGFVYCDGNAYAVYYAGWTLGHHEVGMLIGIGEWGEDARPDSRCSFGLIARSEKSNVVFMVVGPDNSPLGEMKFMGHLLPRDEALSHPEIQDVYHVAEHIVRDDSRLSAVFND
jgi:hypothetical protein